MKPLAAVVLLLIMLVFVAPASLGDDSGTLDRKLIDAVGRGNLSAVEALIAAGADPNARMDGYPALQFAVRRGTVEIVEALLAAGADVNGFGEWVPGCCQHLDTALHQAVRYRRAEIIQVLLAAGADVDARDKLLGESPLELADSLGFTEIIDILVCAGADPNAR